MTPKNIQCGLIGSRGRLGSLIVEAAQRLPHITICELSRSQTSAIAQHLPGLHCILDVSSAEATVSVLNQLLKSTSQKNIPYIIGSTGFSADDLKVIEKYSTSAPVIVAPNFSIGVNIFFDLVARAHAAIQAFDYESVLHEWHHNKKKDAPSGTAKEILKHMPKLAPTTQVHASRAGSIVGTHELQFISDGDILTLKHEALDRRIFALGALKAAEWITQHGAAGKTYTMHDVLFS